MAGLVAASAVLGGCSDKQEANDSLPSTTAAETTPELPPLGPEDLPMPDEARTQDAAGAEAFARYYIDLINRTSTVMDAEPLRELSGDCRDCDRIARNVEEDAAAGYRYQGGALSLTETGPPLMKPGTAEMAILADQAAATVIDSSGTVLPAMSIEAYPGLSGGVAMRWDVDRETWLMTALTLK